MTNHRQDQALFYLFTEPKDRFYNRDNYSCLSIYMNIYLHLPSPAPFPNQV